jgi:hypothetical protein
VTPGTEPHVIATALVNPLAGVTVIVEEPEANVPEAPAVVVTVVAVEASVNEGAFAAFMVKLTPFVVVPPLVTVTA